MNNNQPTPPMEGGPQITGRWFNPHSGDVINVRDSLIDGDEMYLITDKGRMSMQKFQQYLQVDENDAIPNGPVVPQPSADIKSQLAVTTTTEGALSPDLDIFVDKTIQEQPMVQSSITVNTPVNTSANTSANTPDNTADNTADNTHKENTSFKMIDKIFTKSNIVPKIKLIIEDDNFPYNELAMLMEYFDVSPDDIAEYVKDKFITGDIIKDCIGSYDK